MNRKYNPFVSLVALLLAAIILVLTCTGCTNAAAAENETNTAPRFTYEHVDHRCTIITDNQTGVQYLYYASGYGGGLTKLEG